MKPKRASSAKLATSAAAVAAAAAARRCDNNGLKSHLAFKRGPIQHNSDSTSRGMQTTQASKNSSNSTCVSKNSFIYICAGCSKPIRRDKFLLKACDKYWHENCLKCDRCHSRLGELGSTLFFKSNMNLCRQDYLEMFGETGVCSVCEQLICSSEMVMRAKQNVYHLECFACQLCNQRFCVGDRFYLCENKVVCQYDYEEHILPIQKSLFEQQTAIAGQPQTSNYARQDMPKADQATLNKTSSHPGAIHHVSPSDMTSAGVAVAMTTSCVDPTSINEQSLKAAGPSSPSSARNKTLSEIDIGDSTAVCLPNMEENHYQGQLTDEIEEPQVEDGKSEELPRKKEGGQRNDNDDERNSAMEILAVARQEAALEEQTTSITPDGPGTD